MMQQKTRNMKFINKRKALVFGLLLTLTGVGVMAQDDAKKKVDGVVGVVGEYVILDSDIDKTLVELQAQGISTAGITRCQMFGKLLEDRMFAHHAIQDSLEVTDVEINGFMDQQIETMVERVGSMKEILAFYNKKSVEEFREYFYDIVKQNKLTQNMQSHIVKNVQITPEEVRQFFNEIPKDQLPMVGDEVELAEIVVKPVVSKEQKQKVIDRLNEMRSEVLNGGGSFFSKAVLFSEDKASVPNGGFYSITKKTAFVKEFKDVAFSMAEGEISAPFESEYGFHIIYLEKIRGQQLDLRHILLSPKPTEEAVEEAKVKIEGIRKKIVDGEITFEEAALASSDEKDTRNNGGILRHPMTQDPRFELNKMEDRSLYSLVSNLKEGEISQPAIKVGQTGDKSYRIVKVNKRLKEHLIDYVEDYTKVKELALNKKQGEAVSKWLNDKINDTYIDIQGEYRDCEFQNNWLKK
ncbi:periplasmic chaperone for outer membrane proteins SurA [Myroides guanonis]|uniref:Periplasmic chaperone for outer membrane proteins SurA n=2 Tax=Myroides guanonis TaxID=1150112 RepID=A0A1I3N9J3_9FLAO|nr:periplasmic chaperone for outer membrane proteins SurA [Myroides guanonis]